MLLMVTLKTRHPSFDFVTCFQFKLQQLQQSLGSPNLAHMKKVLQNWKDLCQEVGLQRPNATEWQYDQMRKLPRASMRVWPIILLLLSSTKAKLSALVVS